MQNSNIDIYQTLRSKSSLNMCNSTIILDKKPTITLDKNHIYSAIPIKQSRLPFPVSIIRNKPFTLIPLRQKDVRLKPDIIDTPKAIKMSHSESLVSPSPTLSKIKSNRTIYLITMLHIAARKNSEIKRDKIRSNSLFHTLIQRRFWFSLIDRLNTGYKVSSK